MENSVNNSAQLENVVTFKGIQVTGITICTSGRMFVNFPRWRDGVPYSVAEVFRDGSVRPYPDRQTNSWENGSPLDPAKFVCVQSVVAYMGKLYVLDTKNPTMKQIIDTPTIFVYDLRTDELIKKYTLEDSTGEHSYTNDLRVDDKTGKIYLTDSGSGGLIVLDMKTGENYRVLDGHPFTRAEFDHFEPNGTPYSGSIHSDGIALDRKNDILYFHALTGYTLYGIPTGQLIDRKIDEKQITSLVTPAPDGMIMDELGRLYMGDLEKSEVAYYESGQWDKKVLVSGGDISWPDTFTIHDDYLYFTNSRIQDATGDISDMEFPVNRVKLPR